MAKVMIEAAINGNAMRKINPHIPYSPEEIAADAKCDVLIGVEGKHGTLLIDESAQSGSSAG